MSTMRRPRAVLDVPTPPRLRPNWTTWMWIGLAVCVAVATIVGVLYAARP